MDRSRVRLSAASPAPTGRLSTETFEYRPWQFQFDDVLGNGHVNFNVSPVQEARWKVGKTNSQIATGNMTFFTLPDHESLVLPTDPGECAEDAEGCVPPEAQPCDPNAGCAPRLVVIGTGDTEQSMTGVFDTKTGAFIATANVRQNFRLLFSLGDHLDGVYGVLLAKLKFAAKKAGINLPTLLATTVRWRNGPTEVKLNLINGLQIDEVEAPSGVQIVSDTTAQAGLILNLYTRLDNSDATCVETAGDSDPDDRGTQPIQAIRRCRLHSSTL